MARNQKLTPIIAGRTIESVNNSGEKTVIQFTDGSRAHVKTAERPKPAELKDRTVKAVRQSEDVMNLDFEDGESAEIKLAGPTASVLLRDSDGGLEYMD
jgi:hypothetical protein